MFLLWRGWTKPLLMALLGVAGLAVLAGLHQAEPQAAEGRPADSRSSGNRPGALPPQAARPLSPERLPSPASAREAGPAPVRLCQACVPAVQGVDCALGGCGEAHWSQWGPVPFQQYFQGEYVGPARDRHVPEYRLRVDDVLEFVYRLTRENMGRAYELNIGDILRVEVLADPSIDRQLEVQPDGTVTLPYLGQVRAAGLTIPQLHDLILEQYHRLYPDTTITVTPIKVNTRLEDLRAAVDRRFGSGGQDRQARITPEGTIQLPAIGSVQAQGLTLEELKYEVDERYSQIVGGIEVTPVLQSRAPSYIFVVGEVRQPSRYVLERPTTAIGAVALAGGWLNGGNLRNVVVFRRTDDWRLLATKLDLRGALVGKRPTPADDLWLRDSDIVLVPKSPLLIIDDSINLLFTRGIYAVAPTSFSITALSNQQQ